MELECAGMKGGLESGDKLAAEDTTEHFDGKKKERWEEIQRAWPGAMPPAASTQWT